MNTSFEIAGIKQVPKEEPELKKKWYYGKPVFAIFFLFLIVTSCLACDLIMPKDPTYMDLSNFNQSPNSEQILWGVIFFP